MSKRRGKRVDIRFGDVWLVDFDPTSGAELGKPRPAVVVSPDWLNRRVRTAIVVPLTTVRRGWPSRVPTSVGGTPGEAAADQVRTRDKDQFKMPFGRMDAAEFDAVLAKLRELFTPPPTSAAPRTPAAGHRT